MAKTELNPAPPEVAPESEEKPTTEQKEETPAEKKEVLKPVLTGKSKAFTEPENVIVLQPGQVYIVPLDDKGNEIAGAGFKTNMTAYNRHYNNPKKYILKKKA